MFLSMHRYCQRKVFLTLLHLKLDDDRRLHGSPIEPQYCQLFMLILDNSLDSSARRIEFTCYIYQLVKSHQLKTK